MAWISSRKRVCHTKGDFALQIAARLPQCSETIFSAKQLKLFSPIYLHLMNLITGRFLTEPRYCKNFAMLLINSSRAVIKILNKAWLMENMVQ